jgi:predicted nuclease of predicted toxin-antitoxin system
MRLYLDQMFGVELAKLLHAEGHDVLRASEAGQARSDDDEIMKQAIAEDRVLITLDEHFGDWTVLPLKEHSGVIRIKIHPPFADVLAKRLVPFLLDHDKEELKNHLIILGLVRERWINTAD